MPDTQDTPLDEAQFDAGLARFIKEASLSEPDGLVVRQGAAHIDPAAFGDWLEHLLKTRPSGK